jgi:hypothetical protein
VFFVFEVSKERDFVHFSGLGDLSGSRSLKSSSGQDKSGGVDKPFPGLIDGRTAGTEWVIARILHASTYLHRYGPECKWKLAFVGTTDVSAYRRIGVSACRRIGVSAYRRTVVASPELQGSS